MPNTQNQNDIPIRLINAFNTLQNAHGPSPLFFELADKPFALLFQSLLSVLCIPVDPLLHRHLLLRACQVSACFTLRTGVLLVAVSRKKYTLDINRSPRVRCLQAACVCILLGWRWCVDSQWSPLRRLFGWGQRIIP